MKTQPKLNHAAVAGAVGLLLYTQSVSAQDDKNSRADYLADLKVCQLIESDADRLACFDKSVSTIVAANDAGEVRVVDREDVKETRRKLFGFALPKINLFGGDNEEEEIDDLLETTITSVAYQGRNGVTFRTAEDAVWQVRSLPRRMDPIKPGDTVVFKKAALGSFFIRINGQMGVKGKRIE